MEHEFDTYDKPDPIYKRFDEKVKKRFQKEQNPIIKPNKIFIGFNKKK